MPDWLDRAARNNAEWCQAMYRAHGRAGVFLPDLWYNPGDALPFYPTVVTLTGRSGVEKQIALVEALISSGLSGAWAVKDSYTALDLSAYGFRELFRADWIYALPQAIEQNALEGMQWGRVTTGADLTLWERAWRGTADPSGLFPAALVEDANHAVIAVYRDGDIVAGCIASHAADVVGISNLFLPEQDAVRYRRACVAAAATYFHGVPLVGYEHGSDLAAMKQLGFGTVGQLRVWMRDGQVGVT